MKYLKLFEDLDKVSYGTTRRLSKLIDDINELGGGSFQNIAGGRDMRSQNIDPESDTIEELIEELKEKGWSVERMKKIVNKYGPSMATNSESESAIGDILLYKLSDLPPKERYTLGNMNFYETPYVEDELFIKYSYGWHRSFYGKMYLEQQLGSKEIFLNKMATDFLHNYFIGNKFYQTHTYQTFKNNSDEILKMMESCTKVVNNEFIITNVNDFNKVLKDTKLDTYFITHGGGKIRLLDNLISDMESIGVTVIKSPNSIKFIFE